MVSVVLQLQHTTNGRLNVSERRLLSHIYIYRQAYVDQLLWVLLGLHSNISAQWWQTFHSLWFKGCMINRACCMWLGSIPKSSSADWPNHRAPFSKMKMFPLSMVCWSHELLGLPPRMKKTTAPVELQDHLMSGSEQIIFFFTRFLETTWHRTDLWPFNNSQKQFRWWQM